MSYQLIDIQNALTAISSSISQQEKNISLNLLEDFQKSMDAWKICINILLDTTLSQQTDLKMFASQTLRNKVTYDLSQLTDSNNITSFKDNLLNIIISYGNNTDHSTKLILVQLNVALARLAIQFIDWKNPMQEIISILNPYPSILLSFLKILPEETLDLGSYPLTQAEFDSRINELVTMISNDVLHFLLSTIESLTSNGLSLDQIFKCFASWSFEFEIDTLLSLQSLLSLLFTTLSQASALEDSNILDAATDCLCNILRETREVQNEQLIMPLYENLVALQNSILPTLLSTDSITLPDVIDDDIIGNFTRIFVEAAEAWAIFIAKSPEIYQQLVTIVLMLTCKVQDLDIVSYTFPFWFSLKQSLVLPRYSASKTAYTPTFISLINGIINHLQYPLDSFSTLEEEDKFKDFRYSMGDVLKDCTAVVGTANALNQPFMRLNDNSKSNSNWQYFEAPLFSLRTMAQEVSLSENNLIPKILYLICNATTTVSDKTQSPLIHPKIRYATTLVLGRYTEWAAKHPELLELQLNYIFQNFSEFNNDKELMIASSHSLMYFCTDCSSLLINYLSQLIDFYFNVENIIDIESNFELCQGLSSVLQKQSTELLPSYFQKLIDNILKNLNSLTKDWSDNSQDNNIAHKIADKIDLIFALFEDLKPKNDFTVNLDEPILPQIEFIWSTLKTLLVDLNGQANETILERSTKLLRRLIEKYHVYIQNILPSIMEFLVEGYSQTGFGSFLWCSGSLIACYGDEESLPISKEIRNAVWEFSLSQCNTFLINFEKIQKSELNNFYEMIMDFFAMCSDLLMFYPGEFINSNDSILLTNIFDIALGSVTHLENFDSYLFILRFMDDIISWGFKTPPISTLTIEVVPQSWREQILQKLIVMRGLNLTKTLFQGLLTNFHVNAQSDAVSCLVKSFRLATELNNNDPSVCISWVNEGVIKELHDVTPSEIENLNNSVIRGLNKKITEKLEKVSNRLSIGISEDMFPETQLKFLLLKSFFLFIIIIQFVCSITTINTSYYPYYL
ncbi:hypothetical protein TBLA_0A06770 [Henningerozyma blattae CBS 6284]|uniref:Importin N-terminal domain-containing protein n=1 Tax=Henningerozyma blattae (strain ATCC 34711 / CBS 6284 / DSM 70876 / NBRC 10599 / NRRL Y-10934 / UCD 77-7) TaxID=1071380 RepID=I2GWG7_HENB6|nr:hypothetical protein TBLA_0A06770 [Tetrapisispora blattae CBS 6284]CCH58469.1 hypothetical protein TBLA_0A06770 [Tetrapisispora blattae CBS 6284]